jgi:hypothetical protein
MSAAALRRSAVAKARVSRATTPDTGNDEPDVSAVGLIYVTDTEEGVKDEVAGEVGRGKPGTMHDTRREPA